MLKVLKVLLVAVGVVLIAATIGLVIWNTIQINFLVATADAANMEINQNPRLWTMLGAGGALAGGFALGFGLGLPRRTFKQRLAEHTDDHTPDVSHSAD